MNKILRNASISEIQQAIEKNIYHFWKTCTKIDLKGVEYTENEQFYRFSSGIPFFTVNGVLDTKIPLNIVEETIDDIILSYKMKKLPFYWFVGPLSKPDNLRELLLEKKPNFIEILPGFALNLKQLSKEKKHPPNLTIKKVQDYETFKLWIEIFLNAFELPMDLLFDFYLESLSLVLLDNSEINTYLAYYDGIPVATSIRIYGSGVLGLYGVTTTKKARGNRIGTEMTLAPLYEAKKAGYEFGVLHS